MDPAYQFRRRGQRRGASTPPSSRLWRAEGGGLLGKSGTAGPLGNGADLLDDELAQPALVWPDLQFEGAVVEDLQGDLAGEPGVDRRRRDVGGHPQACHLAPAFDTRGRLAL